MDRRNVVFATFAVNPLRVVNPVVGLVGMPLNYPGFFKFKEKTLKNRVLSAAVMSLLSSVALADTYQAEAGLFYNNTDADTMASDYDTYGINASIFLKPVDDSKGPRLEAAFLDRASGISVQYSDPDDIPVDETYAVQGRYVLGNGTILEAGYADFDIDESFHIGLGTYLSDTSAVMLRYSETDDSDVQRLEASYKAVAKLAGTSAVAYSVSAGLVDVPHQDTGYSFGGEATYYFNQNFGIGATVSFQDLDSGDIESYGLQASYFFTPNFYVQGFAKTTDFDGPDEEQFGLSASIRF